MVKVVSPNRTSRVQHSHLDDQSPGCLNAGSSKRTISAAPTAKPNAHRQFQLPSSGPAAVDCGRTGGLVQHTEEQRNAPEDPTRDMHHGMVSVPSGEVPESAGLIFYLHSVNS